MPAITYAVSETFYSIQGEGFWTGTPSYFIRLAGCNLSCPWCDTDFECKENLTAEELFARAIKETAPPSPNPQPSIPEPRTSFSESRTPIPNPRTPSLHSRTSIPESQSPSPESRILNPGIACRRLVLTGGEPTLQRIQPLIDYFRKRGWFVAIETNGTGGEIMADWITVSPKAGCDYPNGLKGDEIKIVFDGKIDPARFTSCAFTHFFIQPCSRDYAPAVEYVLKHPEWRLSLQTQFIIGIR